MNAKQYRDALAKLELTQAAAAELLGIALRTSNGYARGDTAPRKSEADILNLLVRGKIKLADLS